MGQASRVWHRRRRKIAISQLFKLISITAISVESWGIVPGIERHPLKKLAVDEHALLKLLRRWQAEAVKAGHTVNRVAVAFEAGRDGFWLAGWLRARDIEAYVIHPSSVAVSREHRRAKTDRLDTELLKRTFIGWLRGEPHHCHMAAIPTIEEEDAKRSNRERENLVCERSRIINRMKACLIQFGVRAFKPTLRKASERLVELQTPEGVPLPPNTIAEMHRDMGIETADMLVHEVLSRNMRDRRAVARYAGITGSPDESGKKRREKGARQSGQCTGPTRHDSIGLALPQIPEG
jgi:transposase